MQFKIIKMDLIQLNSMDYLIRKEHVTLKVTSEKYGLDLHVFDQVNLPPCLLKLIIKLRCEIIKHNLI